MGVPVNRPGKDALDAVEDLLVSIVLVVRRRQLLPDRDENLEHRDGSAGIMPVRRNRIPSGPILMVSSEASTLLVR